MTVPTLKQLREAIDKLDAELLKMISQRARIAQQVAEVKLAEHSRDSADPAEADLSQVLFYRPEREAQVLRKVMADNPGPLADSTVAHLFREIMSACLALEKPMEVAYLGPAGTFTEAAVLKHFGHAVISRPQTTIGEVFQSVEAHQCNYGVVPVENSTEGMVTHTLDSFMGSPLKICGEVELKIELQLLASADTPAERVTRIVAHQQALAQCQHWLDAHWPGVVREAVSSNGEGARLAASQPGTAAVAGSIAAEQYGLLPLAENIQDAPDNATRFLVIGHEAVPPSGQDKTSLVVSTHNEPGALFQLLEPFHREGISLTRIDTRPSRTQAWAYVFFIEFEGHQQDAAVARILEELQGRSILLKPLGSYPQAVI